MDVSLLVRLARRHTGLSLREFATRAETSYSTLSDYERGTKTPTVETLVRIVEAAGLALETALVPNAPPSRGDRDDRPRGEQLIEVLDLAGHFPTRHHRTSEGRRVGETLRYPVLRNALRST